MREKAEQEKDEEPEVQQGQACPGGIPARLLAKMSQEDIDEWCRIDWLNSPSKGVPPCRE